MRIGLRAVCSTVLVPMLWASAAPAQKRQPRVGHSRHVFVNVTDAAGAPILDLTDADFEVTDGARKREILSSGLAKSPMRIALLIDTSDGTANAINQIRVGLPAFLDALPPDAEVMVVSTGRQIRVRLQPTTDRKKALDLAKGLFSDGGATPLRDALLEIDDRFFRKTENRWPMFVIVTGDSAESSAPANETKFNKWLNEIPARGISAHAFALKYRGGGVPDLVAQHVVQTAGGRFDYMNTANALPDKLKALGEQVANDAKEMGRWYDVEFETNSDGSSPVEVGVVRAGVAIRVSYRRVTKER
jgi:von Willebrand factor type A domain